MLGQLRPQQCFRPGNLRDWMVLALWPRLVACVVLGVIFLLLLDTCCCAQSTTPTAAPTGRRCAESQWQKHRRMAFGVTDLFFEVGRIGPTCAQ